MRNRLPVYFTAGLLFCAAACAPAEPPVAMEPHVPEVTDAGTGKPVVYQVFTRLFGNQETTNKPWGTIEENGVGKFSDFDDTALEGIRELGVTHIWYTGVPHHAVIRDYSGFGIGDDDPDVVKGRAGSPYAVKDYYTVNPDLADDPARRLEEFEELIARTHAHGMQVIIDIVPNHVARGYESLARPDGVEDFGASDDTSVEYARDNNFYYVVGEDFSVPESPRDYAPLGGDAHPLADGRFDETPAKWTGNGARAPQPDFNDWFETVKVNYGVRPDGSYDFDRLPDDARGWTTAEHAAFWADRDVPDSWTKFRDIVTYWTGKGVDGFRYDMVEMVPVEFWSYLNSGIKTINDDAFLLAEVYNPDLYRDYLELGRMDYLYDKVGFYDALKLVMQGKEPAWTLEPVHAEVLDIEEHMLHFLENHDEQRIASADFAGDARMGMPAMTVSALISRSPTMLYFGQDVGEPGDGNPGFGAATRTTIFDYWGVPAHQRWMNDGRFDGGALSDDEKALRDFYVRLMSFSAASPVLHGSYAPLAAMNWNSDARNPSVFAFVRWTEDERLFVAANFDREKTHIVDLQVPETLVPMLGLTDGRYTLDERLYGERYARLVIENGIGTLRMELAPFESAVLRLGHQDIMRHADMPSAHVKPRHVDVWLPDGYAESDEHYSVLYMHDGQNLFNEEITWNQQAWDVDVALQALLDEGRVENTIVVGIWNTDLRRREYLPHAFFDVLSNEEQQSAVNAIEGEPLSREYLRFIVEELKPFIDGNYRTKSGRDDTFVMGSSMGGLISLYAMTQYPDVFVAAGCVSTHWPLSPSTNDTDNTEAVVTWLRENVPAAGEHRFYFDYGTTELDAVYEQHQRLVDALFLELGYGEDDFVSRRFDGAGHNENAWRARADIPLVFLLGDES
ncbi:MAG: alpha/beta hydrolase-fold protein [Woeseiaceae bacterium]|nr:alpha/beta hydrolase-fold protein [Woeseiaceae bacterium]